MKRTLALLLALIMMLGLLAGCSGKTETPAQSSETTAAPSEPKSSAPAEQTDAPTDEASNLTFTDSNGTVFTLDKPLEKVIVLNRQTAEAFKLLGAENVVIATGDTTVANNPYLGFNDLPDMGKTGELNMEAILSLEPDAVFCYTNRAMELEDTLTPAGIPVIRIDNYQPEKYNEEMLLLGRILGKEDRAKEFLNYRDSVEQLVADRIATIAEEDRPTVMALSVGFMNSQGGYRIFPCYSIDGAPGVGEGYSTILAGGKDASPDIKYDPVEAGTTILVEPEYALACNPDVITLHGTWLGGYNCTDENDFQTVIDNIYEISNIAQTTAGAEKRVYVFHTDFLGASKRYIGVLQLCKYLHPELFEDIDPESYAKDYFENWLGAEYQGIWYYAAK